MDFPLNELMHQEFTRNRKLANDENVSWVNSEAALSSKEIDYPVPDILDGTTPIDKTNAVLNRDAKYLVVIYNPSAETALTVTAKNKMAILASADRFTEVQVLNVPINSTKQFIVTGLFLGDGSRLSLSNDTVIGAAGAFSATVRIIAL